MMKKLIIDQSKVNDSVVATLMKLCPFGGLEYKDGKLDFTAGCKTCGICARKGPTGVITLIEEKDVIKLNKDEWHGLGVYMEINDERVHPVSFELIGKAKELAKKINHEVFAILVGNKNQVEKYSDEILSYGVNKVYIYQDELLAPFNIERHAKCVEDFITKIKPVAVLYGGTSLGRSLAPRIAAHFRTGLTADCTMLDMKENTDLVQVRPAFGGNVMAQIICPNHRPQMATVRYKIFKMPEKVKPFGDKVYMELKGFDFSTGINIVEIKQKEKVVDISEADIIVACGRAFKNSDDLKMAEELAEELGGVVAVTRPLIEAGLKDAKFQIGLSGRTVAPKLIIVLGVSGAVQFTAGMTGSELIIAVNSDPKASIFDVAHYGIVGDVYKVVPQLIENIRKSKQGNGR